MRREHERADAVRRESVSKRWRRRREIPGRKPRKDGVNSTESGLQFRVFDAGRRRDSGAYRRVRVHYTGKFG